MEAACCLLKILAAWLKVRENSLPVRGVEAVPLRPKGTLLLVNRHLEAVGCFFQLPLNSSNAI